MSKKAFLISDFGFSIADLLLCTIRTAWRGACGAICDNPQSAKARMIFVIAIFSALPGCTEQQREGWKERAGKISGKEEREAHAEPLDPDNFALDDEKQTLVGIVTTTVKRRIIDEVLELPAELVPNPNNVAEINAPVEGRIAALKVNLGSAVEQNAVVAVIENPQNLGQRFEVRSPLRGIVTERPVNVGEWIEAGKEIMEVVDYSSLHAAIRLYPDEQAKAGIGQTVEIESDGIVAKGKIALLSPAVDPATRTIEARAEIPNPQHQLKANAYATAKILIGTKEALVAPQSAVLNEEAHYIVFVRDADGRFEKRVIEVGIRRNGLVEILSGVREGEMMVSEGAYQLKNINFTSSAGEEE
jgi:multidrug efflux pump subunit AcrA (membrane-fusion protein)